jgi:hypothetical protein
MYNPKLNYMDKTLTRHHDHNDKLGEITNIYILAALFQIRAVVYGAASVPLWTYYINRRKYD